MSKRSFFGSSTDDTDNRPAADADADADAKAEKNNPSTAGTQDPGLQSAAGGQASDASARPVNILRDDRNPETNDGSVNPFNTSAAQIPAVVPLDRATDEEAEAQAARLKKPANDTDRKDALAQWGRSVRSRGGSPSSADWERFQELTGERTPQPTPEDIARQQRERDQGTSDAAQRATGNANTNRT